MSTTAVAENTVGPTADDIEPVKHETADRIATGTITVLPFIALGIVGWQLWNDLLHWSDVAVFLIMYALTAGGVTVGFHRYLTHRSFKTSRPVRAVLAVLGSAAIEGPVISWVADHRSTTPSPTRRATRTARTWATRAGWRGAFTGLVHAHVGWLFIHTQRGRPAPLRAGPLARSGRELRGPHLPRLGPRRAGRGVRPRLCHRRHPTAALTGLLWGGGVRLLVVHHVTYSINSLCHFFGRRRFETDDESRNLLWLAPLSFGESWHNNHHAFPTSASHGMSRWAVDPSWLVIRRWRRSDSPGTWCAWTPRAWRARPSPTPPERASAHRWASLGPG